LANEVPFANKDIQFSTADLGKLVKGANSMINEYQNGLLDVNNSRAHSTSMHKRKLVWESFKNKLTKAAELHIKTDQWIGQYAGTRLAPLIPALKTSPKGLIGVIPVGLGLKYWKDNKPESAFGRALNYFDET